MVNFLDLQDIFINEIFGDKMLFLIGSIAIIFMLCAYFRFNNQTTMMIIVAYSLIIAQTIGILLPMALFFVGFFVAWMLYRAMTKTG